MPDFPVHVQPAEIRHAALVGIGRQLAAVAQDRPSDVKHCWEVHFTGALGELAVAKALGIYWEPNVGGSDRAVGDVAGWQVRATANADGSLIVRDQDPDRAAFVLVTGEPPCLHIRGWLHAGDAKQDRYRRAPNGRPPAYFVPPGDLQPWDGRPF